MNSAVAIVKTWRILTKYSNTDVDGYKKLKDLYQKAFNEPVTADTPILAPSADDGNRIPKLTVEIAGGLLEEAFKVHTEPHDLTPMVNHVMTLLFEYQRNRSSPFANDPISLFILVVHDVLRSLLQHSINAETEAKLGELATFVGLVQNSNLREMGEGIKKSIAEPLDKFKVAIARMLKVVKQARQDEGIGSQLRRLASANCNLVDILFTYLSLFSSTESVPAHSVLAFHHDRPSTELRKWLSNESNPMGKLLLCAAYHPSITAAMAIEPKLRITAQPTRDLTKFLYETKEPDARTREVFHRSFAGNTIKNFRQQTISDTVLKICGSMLVSAEFVTCTKDAAFVCASVGDLGVSGSPVATRVIKSLLDAVTATTDRIFDAVSLLQNSVDEAQTSEAAMTSPWSRNVEPTKAAFDLIKKQVECIRSTVTGIDTELKNAMDPKRIGEVHSRMHNLVATLATVAQQNDHYLTDDVAKGLLDAPKIVQTSDLDERHRMITPPAAAAAAALVQQPTHAPNTLLHEFTLDSSQFASSFNSIRPLAGNTVEDFYTMMGSDQLSLMTLKYPADPTASLSLKEVSNGTMFHPKEDVVVGWRGHFMRFHLASREYESFAPGANMGTMKLPHDAYARSVAHRHAHHSPERHPSALILAYRPGDNTCFLAEFQNGLVNEYGTHTFPASLKNTCVSFDYTFDPSTNSLVVATLCHDKGSVAPPTSQGYYITVWKDCEGRGGLAPFKLRIRDAFRSVHLCTPDLIAAITERSLCLFSAATGELITQQSFDSRLCQCIQAIPGYVIVAEEGESGSTQPIMHWVAVADGASSCRDAIQSMGKIKHFVVATVDRPDGQRWNTVVVGENCLRRYGQKV